jgi:hypothetical protein
METVVKLLEEINKRTISNAKNLDSLANSQNMVIDNYEVLLKSYNDFLNTLTKNQDAKATQKYKRKALIVQVLLSILSIVNLFLGKYLPSIFGGG